MLPTAIKMSSGGRAGVCLPSRRIAEQKLTYVSHLGLENVSCARKLYAQRLAGAGMTNFCVLAYVNGRPVSADRLVASSPAEAVRLLLQDKQLASCEVYQGRRVVAAIDGGLITIAGQRA